MDKQTLSSDKLTVYVLLKILKYCTNSSVRSYQCKFAIDRVFRNKDPGGYIVSINELIQFYTIRGKFSSIHPDLAAEGITKLEVCDTGFHFITKQPKGNFLYIL